MNEAQNGPSEPSKVDTAASAACVRSGAFALLLSLALLLLIPNWREQPMYAALRVYVAERLDLASAIERLDDDPIWQKYKATNEAAESLSIAQLSSIHVEITAGDKVEPVRPKLALRSKEKIRKPGSGTNLTPPTTAPILLKASLVMEVPEAPRLVESLIKLNDSDTLTRTRQVSNYFSFSIARWASKRSTLVYRNYIANLSNPCISKELEVPHQEEKPPGFIPALGGETLLRCLTVRDVRELAHFEQPTVSNPIELGGRIGPMIEVAPGSLPRGAIELYSATVAAQVLLFFVVMYFGAFAREAVVSATFPAPGTLFGAFRRSRWTLLVLFFAPLVPLGTSVLVAVFARKWLIGVCALFVGLAAFSVYFVLGTKSYFRAIDPRGLIHRALNTLSRMVSRK